MARQARILDFEAAKSASSFRTPSRASAASGHRVRGAKGTQTSSRTRGAGTAVRSRKTQAAQKSAARTQGGAKAQGRASSRAKDLRRGRATDAPARTRRSGGAAVSARKEGSSRKGGASAQRKDSAFSKVKRDRVKKKASRLFADIADAPASSEGEPRAALYKATMGSKHRKSSKLQSRAKETGSFSIPWTNYIGRLNSKMGIAVIACLCVLAVGAFLYMPVKNYYTAIRDQAKAEAAYEAVSTRNDALKQDVAALVTDGGIEDRAREQYGWVKKGENAVVVTGLSESGDPSPAEVLRTVVVDDIQAPETWYSPVLDRVFAYA